MPRLSHVRDVAVNAAMIGAQVSQREGTQGSSPLWYADDVATLAVALTEAEDGARKKYGNTLYNDGWDDYESVCVALARVARDRGEMTLGEARKWVKAALKEG